MKSSALANVANANVVAAMTLRAIYKFLQPRDKRLHAIG
jgi:hypothetical protein